jgi:hypothetical protein
MRISGLLFQAARRDHHSIPPIIELEGSGGFQSLFTFRRPVLQE